MTTPGFYHSIVGLVCTFFPTWFSIIPKPNSVDTTLW